MVALSKESTDPWAAALRLAVDHGTRVLGPWVQQLLFQISASAMCEERCNYQYRYHHRYLIQLTNPLWVKYLERLMQQPNPADTLGYSNKLEDRCQTTVGAAARRNYKLLTDTVLLFFFWNY